MAKAVKKQSTQKKAKKLESSYGKVFVYSTSNNTIITITDDSGATISWGSPGIAGFKGSRKATPYAAQLAAELAGKKAHERGLREVDIFLKGIGAGRESAIRGIKTSEISVLSIADVTPVPHNGCRPKKPRRM